MCKILKAALWAFFLSCFTGLAVDFFSLQYRSTPETAVVAGGQANAMIIYSASDRRFEAAGKDLQQQLQKKYGKVFPLVADTEVCQQRIAPVGEVYKNKNLILLGNIECNRVMIPLYAAWLCGEDSYYPGDDGHTVRTVCNPWGTGKNCIIIGGSSPAGLKQGIDAFVNLLPAEKNGSVLLPFTITVKPGRNLAPAFSKLEYSASNFKVKKPAVLAEFIETFDFLTVRYYWSGDIRWGKMAKQYFDYVNADYNGKYYPLCDYTANQFIKSWEMLENAPLFTAAERALTARRIAQTAFHLDWSAINDYIAGRHKATAKQAGWNLLRYMQRSFSGDTAFMRELQARETLFRKYFKLADSGYETGDDTFSCITVNSFFIRRALQEGETAYFQNGNDRLAAGYAINALVDSLGMRTGFGTYGEAKVGVTFAAAKLGYEINLLAFATQDPRINWLAKNLKCCEEKESGYSLWTFNNIGTFMPPDDAATVIPKALLGMNALPFTAQYFADRESPHRGAPSSAWNDYCNKVSWRSGFGENDAYLLLQTRLMPRLANNGSIVRYTDKGKIWLVSNSDREGLFLRNGVSVRSETAKDALPQSSRTPAMMRFAEISACQLKTDEYSDTEWYRVIFRKEGEWFAVLDRLKIKKSGNFSLQCNWRLPYECAVTDNNFLECRQGKYVFYLHNGGDERCWGERAVDVEGGCRPFFWRSAQGGSFARGQDLSFANVFYVVPVEQGMVYRARKINASNMLVDKRGGGAWLLGIAGGAVGGIETDAAIYAVSATEVYLNNVRKFVVNGVTLLNLPETRTVKIDLNSGEIVTGYGKNEIFLAARTWQYPDSNIIGKLDKTKCAAAVSALTGIIGKLAKSEQKTADRNVAVYKEKGLRLTAQYAAVNDNKMPVQGLSVECHGNQRGQEAILQAGIAASGIWPDAPSWSKGSQARINLSWSKPENISEIRLFVGSGQYSIPAHGSCEVEAVWSNDNFKTDIRKTKVRASWISEAQGQSKGKCSYYRYLIIRPEQGESINASAVRLCLPYQEGFSTMYGLTVSEVRVLTEKKGGQVPITRIETADLFNTGKKQIIIAAGNGEFSVGDANGKILWTKRFPGKVDFSVGDIDGDGKKEILCVCYDGNLYAVSPSGNELWKISLAGTKEKSGGKYYSYGTTPFYAYAWEPEPGRRYVVVFGYYYASLLDPKGKILEHRTSQGWYTDKAFTYKDIDGSVALIARAYHNSAGVGDVMWMNFKDPKNFVNRYSWPATSSRVILSQALDGKYAQRMIDVTQDGCGLYNLEKIRKFVKGYRERMELPIWQNFSNFSAALLHETDGSGEPRLIVASPDGLLKTIELGTGKVLGSVLFGHTVNGLAAFGKKQDSRYIIAASDGLRLYSNDWKLNGFAPGSFIDVKNLNENKFVAVKSNGKVCVYTFD